MSAPVLVCFAVSQEARAFQKMIRRHEEVRVLITGMGARNAERSIRAALKEFQPARVFTSGFAGALNPELQIGDVVFDRMTTRAERARQLESLRAQPALFLCAKKIAVTVGEKAALRSSSHADVVEMESEIIHAVCAARGLECVTLRAISDTAQEDLPLNFNALLTPDERLSAARLAWAILKAPQKIPALMKLGRNSARAAEQLAQVLVPLL